MSRNILNQNAEVNVYLNRSPIESTLPVQALQPTEQDPITISLKGLSGFTGYAGKVIKVNTNENALEYADDDDTQYSAGNQLNLSGTTFNLDTVVDVDRLTAGGSSSFTTSHPITCYGPSYFRGAMDIDGAPIGGSRLYMSANTNASSDIYMGTQNSENQATNDGILIRGTNTSSTASNLKINSVIDGANTDRFQFSWDDNTGFDMYQKDASSELNLNFKSNVSNDNFNAKIDVESPSYELIYNAASSNSIFKYYFQGATSQFQITPQTKFVSNSFRNNADDVINFPQNADGETLATVEGIANTTYWDLNSPNLHPKSNLYNVLIGTQTPDASAPKLEVNGDTLLGGDVATTGNLTVRSRYKVEFNSPYTYLYDPTSYSTANPYSQFHTNGTIHILNLPVDSGANSLFKFTKTGTTDIMTLDATGLMTLNGDDVCEINIKNTGNTNDVSTLKFSNATNSNLYKFQFMDSAGAFTFFRDAIPVFQHNSATDVFEVNSQLTVADGATSALELSSNTNTGAQSIVNFTTNGTSKYTYVYDNDTGSFSLKNAGAANLFQITSANVYTSSIDHNISGKLTLSGSTPQISDGTNNYTLPTDKGGTFAMRSDLANQVLNVSGTTMTCDTAADQTDICTEFKVSANGSDGDVSLIVEADRNNTNQDSNPKILLKQDGGNSVGTIEFQTTGNLLKISNSVSGSDLDLATNGGVVKIDSDGSTSGDFDLTSDSKNINFQNYGSGGQQSFMNKLRFNDNDDCYISGQYETNNNSVGNDIVVKMSGGDMRLFRGNSPNSNASNYDSLLFINPSQTLFLYGGGSSTNIFLSSTAFDGNRVYSGGTSDDRLKHEEELITDATGTLMKLRPQIYMKDSELPQSRDRKNPDVIVDNEDITQVKEAGLIAQEVYYQTPELRHLVLTRVDNPDDIQELPDGVDLDDIQNDPDYVSLGWDQYRPANVKYTELIPYLIKMNQEQQHEINSLKEILARNNIV